MAAGGRRSTCAFVALLVGVDLALFALLPVLTHLATDLTHVLARL